MNLYNGIQLELNLHRRATDPKPLPSGYQGLKNYFDQNIHRLSTDTRLSIMQALQHMRKQIQPSG